MTIIKEKIHKFKREWKRHRRGWRERKQTRGIGKRKGRKLCNYILIEILKEAPKRKQMVLG